MITMLGRPVVSGGPGQLLDGQAEGPGFVIEAEFGGVEDDDAIFPYFGKMVVVGFLVKGHQHVHVIARAQDRVDRDAGLGPSGPAQDLGGEGSESQGVVAHLRRRLRQTFGGRDDALPAFASEAYDKITHLHVLHVKETSQPVKWSIARSELM